MIDKIRIFSCIYHLNNFLLSTPYKKNQTKFRTLIIRDPFYNIESFYINNTYSIEIEMYISGLLMKDSNGILKINGKDYPF